MAGKDTFLATDWVIKGLNRWGAFEGKPKGKRALREVQGAFNKWLEESEWPLCRISQTLALSVD